MARLECASLECRSLKNSSVFQNLLKACHGKSKIPLFIRWVKLLFQVNGQSFIVTLKICRQCISSDCQLLPSDIRLDDLSTVPTFVHYIGIELLDQSGIDMTWKRSNWNLIKNVKSLNNFKLYINFWGYMHFINELSLLTCLKSSVVLLWSESNWIII